MSESQEKESSVRESHKIGFHNQNVCSLLIFLFKLFFSLVTEPLSLGLLV